MEIYVYRWYTLLGLLVMLISLLTAIHARVTHKICSLLWFISFQVLGIMASLAGSAYMYYLVIQYSTVCDHRCANKVFYIVMALVFPVDLSLFIFGFIYANRIRKCVEMKTRASRCMKNPHKSSGTYNIRLRQNVNK